VKKRTYEIYGFYDGREFYGYMKSTDPAVADHALFTLVMNADGNAMRGSIVRPADSARAVRREYVWELVVRPAA
jgi:hypothetical protein